MPKRKPILIGISVTQHEQEIIHRESERRGLFNISATVRLIINEWDRDCNDQRVHITEAGREALRKENGS